MKNANRIISTFYNTKTKEDQKIKIAATKIIYEDGTEQNSCGFAAVKKDGVWGSINKVGAVELEPSVNLDSNIYTTFIGKWHLNDSGLYYEK